MQTKGRYEIRGVLGEGGMGIVYRVLDPVLNREVTLKTIRDPQEQAVLELFSECAVLAGMSHPGIRDVRYRGIQARRCHAAVLSHPAAARIGLRGPDRVVRPAASRSSAACRSSCRSAGVSRLGMG